MILTVFNLYNSIPGFVISIASIMSTSRSQSKHLHASFASFVTPMKEGRREEKETNATEPN